MQTTKSTDGTDIAYESTGAGESLVLVHGSTATHEAWLPHVPHLTEAGELHAMDRRGRGASGDAEEHSLEREVEDVAAVLEATHADRLFGHSFGGLCALNAAEHAAVDLEKLVLFEPAILVDEHRRYDAGDRMADLLADDDREGAMRLAFDEMAGIEDVEALPHWPEAIELAEVTQREFAAVEAYKLPDVPAIETETLVLTAEHSPAFLQKAAREVHDRLPNAELVEIEGVGHTGVEDPPAVAAPVLEFLEA